MVKFDSSGTDSRNRLSHVVDSYERVDVEPIQQEATEGQAWRAKRCRRSVIKPGWEGSRHVALWANKGGRLAWHCG